MAGSRKNGALVALVAAMGAMAVEGAGYRAARAPALRNFARFNGKNGKNEWRRSDGGMSQRITPTKELFSKRRIPLRSNAQVLNAISSSVSQTASSSAGWLLISGAVACHEGGHFFAALWQNMLIKEYAIGFGPRIFSRVDKRNISYSLRALPFGGFVSFPGKMRGDMEADEDEAVESIEKDDPEFDPEDPNLLENRPVLQQFLVAVGGIAANILTAYAACYGAANFGIPDPVYGNGVIIDTVEQGGRAQLAGILPGDLISEVDREPMAGATGIKDFVSRIADSPDEPVRLTIKRRNEDPKEVSVTPNSNGKISVKIKPNIEEMKRRRPKNLMATATLAQMEFSRLTIDIIAGYQSIIKGGSAEVAGPIAMAQIGGNTVKTGDISEDLLFFAALNLNLAAANALPIPGLDGAKMVSLLLLGLSNWSGKQLPDKVQSAIDKATEFSAFLLILFVLNVFVSDLVKVLPLDAVLSYTERMLGSSNTDSLR